MMLAGHVRVWGAVLALAFGTVCLAETPREAPKPSGTASPTGADGKHTAAKLAGLVRFVDAFCPSLKPNYPRFRAFIQSLNVNMNELESNDMLMKSSEYTNIYQKDVPASCRNAEEKFGVKGVILPNLFELK